MTVQAASEAALGSLHSKVARVMKGALDVYDAEQEVYLEKVEAGDTEDLIAPVPNASLLSVITKFLSDNKITCVPADSQEVGELEAKLRERRASRKSVKNVIHLATG